MATNPSNTIGTYKVELIKKSLLFPDIQHTIPDEFPVGEGDIKQKDKDSLNVVVNELRREYGEHCRITLVIFEENWTA